MYAQIKLINGEVHSALPVDEEALLKEGKTLDDARNEIEWLGKNFSVLSHIVMDTATGTIYFNPRNTLWIRVVED